MEKYCDDNRLEDSYEDEGCGCGEDNGHEEGGKDRPEKRCFEVVERKCPERPEPCPKPCPKPERPCRCGGHKFVEPKMKRTNCFPRNCGHKHNCHCPCCCG